MEQEPDTEGLTADQRALAEREERLAQGAGGEEEVAQHERRAAKARYLEEKLREREESERADGS